MNEEQPNIKKDILFRVHMLYLFFVLIGVVVFGRLIWVQWGSGEVRSNSERVAAKIFTEETLSAHRGNILSRHGIPFATSLFRYQVEFDFAAQGLDSLETYHEQADSLAGLLAKFFKDKPARAYRKLFREEHARRYRLVNPHPDTTMRSEGWFGQLIDRIIGKPYKIRTVYDTLRDHRPVKIFPRTVNYAEWSVLKEYPLLNWNMGMVYHLVETDERIYPFGGLGRRTIGSIATEGHGYGIEDAFRKELEGKDGKALRQRIAHDFFGRVAGEVENPVDGLDIETTLDAELQVMADNYLREQMIRQKALWGTSMIMKVETGELLALVNLDLMKDGVYREAENRALKMTMDPGSTFKLATVLTLLDDAGMSPLEEHDSNDGRPMVVGGVRVVDSHRGDHKIALKRAVAGSSNIYFAQAVWEHYGLTGKKQQYSDFLAENLCLNAPMGLEMLGERSPKIISEGSWKEVPDPAFKLVKMAYGYRVAMAPIHMLTLYNAIANDGRMMAPMLIRALKRDGKTVREYEPETLSRSICSDRTLRIVRECLEEVAKTGTASRFFRDTTFLRVAAKTGTAQDTSPEGRKYNQYLGSMVAFFPADNPKYTVMTSILTRRQSGYAYYGAPLAGPVVKRMVDYIAMHQPQETPLAAENSFAPVRLKGGDREQIAEVADELLPDWDIDDEKGWIRVRKDSLLHVEEVTTAQNIVPDVRGMGLKEALFLLESRGLKVEVEGQGAVYAQSIAARQKVKVGQKIKINLK